MVTATVTGPWDCLQTCLYNKESKLFSTPKPVFTPLGALWMPVRMQRPTSAVRVMQMSPQGCTGHRQHPRRATGNGGLGGSA